MIKGTGLFAETWNGTKWHLLKVPGPRSPASYELTWLCQVELAPG